MRPTPSLILIAFPLTLQAAAAQEPPPGHEELKPAESMPRTVDEAIREADELLDQLEDETDAEARGELLDRITESLAYIQDEDAGNAWIAFLNARRLIAIGRQRDAVEELKAFVETSEGRSQWRAYKMLGDLFVAGFPRLALAEYSKAAALNATEPSVLFGRSRALANLGNVDGAIESAKKAVEADGRTTPRYVRHYASMLRDGERWDEAVREAAEALRLAKNEAAAHPADRGQLQKLDAYFQLLISTLGAKIAAVERAPVNDYLSLVDYLEERAELARLLASHEIVQVLEAALEEWPDNAPRPLLERYATALEEVGRDEDAAAARARIGVANSGPAATGDSGNGDSQ